MEREVQPINYDQAVSLALDGKTVYVRVPFYYRHRREALRDRAVQEVRANAWDQALKRESEGKLPQWMVEAGETEFERQVQAAGGNTNHPTVREWVRKNHGRHRVPTDVLAACGIQAEEFA